MPPPALIIRGRHLIVERCRRGALFLRGTLTILGPAEGNVGTLNRHRPMVVPIVAVAASPVLASLFGRAGAVLRPVRVTHVAVTRKASVP